MRKEALPLAYRRTAFHLDDVDDFINLAISIGKIGRDNIESLEFAWESRVDAGSTEFDNLISEISHHQLPNLHAQRCVQLLGLCRRLKFLRLYFERDLISNISPDVFRLDSGIRGLCSIRGIHRVEVYSQFCEPLDEYEVIKWLKQNMEGKSSKKREERSSE